MGSLLRSLRLRTSVGNLQVLFAKIALIRKMFKKNAAIRQTSQDVIEKSVFFSVRSLSNTLLENIRAGAQINLEKHQQIFHPVSINSSISQRVTRQSAAGALGLSQPCLVNDVTPCSSKKSESAHQAEFIALRRRTEGKVFKYFFHYSTLIPNTLWVMSYTGNFLADTFVCFHSSL